MRHAIDNNLTPRGRVRLLVTRVHDVLTDGTALYGSDGALRVRLCVRDATAVRTLEEKGVRVAAVESISCAAEGEPLHRWGFSEVAVDAKDVGRTVRALAERFSVPMSEVAVLTADEADVDLMKACGVSLVPERSDAHLMAAADYVIGKEGGRGVLGEAGKIILDYLNTNEPPELSVIIPAFNEAGRIGSTLEAYDRFFSLSEISFELVVVLNGCRDDTLPIVRELAKRRPRIRFVTHADAIGKGGAIVEGFRLASGRYVAFVDADGATRASELLRLLENVGDYDGIIGSRWLRESAVLVRQSFGRRIASRAFNLCVRAILGLPFADTQCGSKVFKRDVVETALDRVFVRNMAFDACLLYAVHRAGYRIKEFPIAWSDKGGSKVSIRKQAPGMVWALIRTRLWPGKGPRVAAPGEKGGPD